MDREWPEEVILTFGTFNKIQFELYQIAKWVLKIFKKLGQYLIFTVYS